MRDGDEVKIAAIVMGGLLLIAGGLMGSCNYQARLDANAPVVESCVRHPATRLPFRTGQ